MATAPLVNAPARARPSTSAPPLRRQPTSTPRASTLNSMQSAKVSSLLAGKPLYRMSNGQWVELPEGMTAEEAGKLEREAKAAEQRLGKGPGPKPVPEVHKPADKTAKNDAKPAHKGPGIGPVVTGGGGPRSVGLRARIAVRGGEVAAYLVGKTTPMLVKGAAMLSRLSRNEQTHENAPNKLRQSEASVLIPASENQSKGNASQVNAVGARQAPAVDASKGRNTLQSSLQENVPKSIEDVDNFKRDMKGQHIGADVLQVVQGDKNAVVSTYADMQQTPKPAAPEHQPVALPAPEAAPGTPAMNLGQGAVAPLQPGHTDVSATTKEADAKLTEEGVTQEQLDMVDNGDLAAANKEKKGMVQMAKTEPAAINQFARQETAKVEGDLKQAEAKQRGLVANERKAGLGKTGEKQQHTKSALEKKRDEVAAHINALYKTTQEKVTARLNDLEKQSMRRFDDGNAQATQAFEGDVNRDIDAFKDDRYSGMFGWARKARDWLLGMDDLPEVKAIFDRNRATFVTRIERLVADISADNARVVQECKDELARTRAEIKSYVDKLGPALKDIGKKVAGEMNRQLDAMDSFVRKKEEDLQQALADKQQAAIKAIDEKIEKMKDAMAGALAKLGKLLLWAAKKFFTWALGKFGYSMGEIEGIINKGAAVLKAIFTKPIVFVKNLMNAAITGFQNFSTNFLKHLKDALFEWLTGSLEGLKLPTTWDFAGVVGVALQMIGISYDNIRRHLVDAIGEPAVVGLEKTFTLVKTLITEGPMAAWEQLQDMAGEMRDAFIEAVKDYVKSKIIEEAIKAVVALFVPGAGIIKAIIGIYDTVVFFIQKAKQIAKMVGNFLSSIGEIAAGNIGAAADSMEAGLARGLSLVISFLAQLLHLNGITAKIRNAIQKIRDKVDAVLAKVAKWIAAKAGKLLGAAKAGVKNALQWWKLKTGISSSEGKSLTLYTEGDEESPKVLIASSPGKPWSDYLNGFSAADKKLAAHVKATDLATKLEAKRKPLPADDKSARQKAADEMNKNFNALATQIKLLNGTSTTPAAVITYGGADGIGGGQEAEATVLSKKHPPGTPPADNAPIWEQLGGLGAGLGEGVRGRWYVQGHLLNHNLGGPGMRFNLTPITKQANNDHKNEVEASIKKKVHEGKGLVLYYKVTIKKAWGSSLKIPRLKTLEAKDSPTKAELAEIEALKTLRKLTRGFTCRAYELEQNDKDKWVKKKGGFEVPSKDIDNNVMNGPDPYGYP